jgi:hypothetical protein
MSHLGPQKQKKTHSRWGPDGAASCADRSLLRLFPLSLSRFFLLSGPSPTTQLDSPLPTSSCSGCRYQAQAVRRNQLLVSGTSLPMCVGFQRPALQLTASRAPERRRRRYLPVHVPTVSPVSTGTSLLYSRDAFCSGCYSGSLLFRYRPDRGIAPSPCMNVPQVRVPVLWVRRRSNKSLVCSPPRKLSRTPAWRPFFFLSLCSVLFSLSLSFCWLLFP